MNSTLGSLVFYFGKVLQLLGLIVMMYVCLLFFGDSKMWMLLKLSGIGLAEFYLGVLLVKIGSK